MTSLDTTRIIRFRNRSHIYWKLRWVGVVPALATLTFINGAINFTSSGLILVSISGLAPVDILLGLSLLIFYGFQSLARSTNRHADDILLSHYRANVNLEKGEK